MQLGARHFEVDIAWMPDQKKILASNKGLNQLDFIRQVHSSLLTFEPLGDALQSMNKFLEENPREVLMVTFEALNGVPKEMMEGLLNETRISQFLPTQTTDWTNTTMGDLIAKNTRFFPIYSDWSMGIPPKGYAEYLYGGTRYSSYDNYFLNDRRCGDYANDGRGLYQIKNWVQWFREEANAGINREYMDYTKKCIKHWGGRKPFIIQADHFSSDPVAPKGILNTAFCLNAPEKCPDPAFKALLLK